VNLRIAEVCYKLDDIDESFRTMAKVEGDLKTTDKYMLHLLKGKCYDKSKQFKQAVFEYNQALEMSKQNNLESEIVG
jgi:predicted negative regulator of RcsB-dependent stress response